jgi:hypothetical protein
MFLMVCAASARLGALDTLPRGATNFVPKCVSAGDTISTAARGGWPSAAVAGGKSTERQAPRPNAAGQKAVPGELLGGRDEKQSRDEEA